MRSRWVQADKLQGEALVGTDVLNQQGLDALDRKLSDMEAQMRQRDLVPCHSVRVEVLLAISIDALPAQLGGLVLPEDENGVEVVSFDDCEMNANTPHPPEDLT